MEIKIKQSPQDEDQITKEYWANVEKLKKDLNLKYYHITDKSKIEKDIHEIEDKIKKLNSIVSHENAIAEDLKTEVNELKKKKRALLASLEEVSNPC